MSTPCYVEFAIDDEARLAALVAVVDALRRDKAAGTIEAGPKWRAFFDERALAHFWWPTPAEHADWQRRWEAAPVPARWSDPTLKTPWDFDSMIDAFHNGEYELLGVRRLGDRARLEYAPDAYPYGGAGCMVALIESFDFRITEIDDC